MIFCFPILQMLGNLEGCAFMTILAVFQIIQHFIYCVHSIVVILLLFQNVSMTSIIHIVILVQINN